MELYPFEIKDRINNLKELTNEVKKPQILSYEGMHTINFHNPTGDEYSYGSGAISWLFETMREKTGTGKDIRACLLALSEEDEVWTKERNKDYTFTAFRRITFLPEAQKLLTDYFAEEISALEKDLKEKEEKAQKERIEREVRHSEWFIKEIYSHKLPKGGETGTDGFIDALYQSKDGATVRMISKDVFDVGVFSFPKRLEGSNNTLAQESWTDDEKSVCRWISEFGEFQGTRM